MRRQIHPRIPLAVWQVAAVVVLLALLVVSLLRGGEEAGRSAELVPETTLVYARATVDGDDDQLSRLASLAARFPSGRLVRAELTSVIRGPGEERLDFDEQVAPWLGSEAALAIIPAGEDSADSLFLLDADDPGAARDLLGSFEAEHEIVEHRGTEVFVWSEDLAAAIVDDFLALGQEETVTMAIDLAEGEGTSLADEGVAERTLDGLPDERVGEVYASAAGLREVIAPQGGVLSQVAQLIDRPSLQGTAVALVAEERGIRLGSFSSLDPEAAQQSPGFGGFPEFRPTLPGVLPADTTLYFGISNFEQTFDALLAQAIVAVPGLAGAFEGFRRGLGRDGQVDIQSELLPMLDGEAALAVLPGGIAPALAIVVEGIEDEAATRRVLAGLQGPISRAISPGEGRGAPTFREREVEGVPVFSVTLNPVVELSYAVFDGRLVVASHPRAIERIRAEGPRLDGSEEYRDALPDGDEAASTVLFLDLEAFVGLAESAGLGNDPDYQQLRADVQRLRGLGLVARGQDDSLEIDVDVRVR